MRRTTLALLILFCATRSVWPASTDDPDKDSELTNLLRAVRTDIEGKNLEDGVAKCDKVIAAFTAHYGASKSKIYCANSSAETLAYLTLAAADMNEGKFPKDKKDAIALSETWATAYFMKAYALQDLGRYPEAKSTLQLAINLSPMNSQYLSEMGNFYIREKNWTKAKELYQRAEDDAPLASDQTRAGIVGVARRGLGYVFVELGQLDQAEKKYKQCLADDPNDKKAAAELEYVHKAQSKKKPPKSGRH